jgi:hypothetical protein
VKSSLKKDIQENRKLRRELFRHDPTQVNNAIKDRDRSVLVTAGFATLIATAGVLYLAGHSSWQTAGVAFVGLLAGGWFAWSRVVPFLLRAESREIEETLSQRAHAQQREHLIDSGLAAHPYERITLREYLDRIDAEVQRARPPGLAEQSSQSQAR